MTWKCSTCDEAIADCECASKIDDRLDAVYERDSSYHEKRLERRLEDPTFRNKFLDELSQMAQDDEGKYK